MDSIRHGGTPSLALLLLAACAGEGSGGTESSDDLPASEAIPAPGAAIGRGLGNSAFHGTADERSAAAGELVARLRDRHGAWPLGLAEGASPEAAQGPGVLVSAGPLRGERPPATLEVTLPELANEAFTLREASSNLSIRVGLLGARAVPVGQVGALSVYADAVGQQATLFYRAGELGVEDYIAFEAPPAAEEVRYRVSLDPSVAGLRLVSRTLEFLDARGAPRLRVAPPYVLGADGVSTHAELEVMGCQVDTSPAPPWGRSPIAPGASVCELRVAWGSTGVEYPALLDPLWSGAASMSTPRESFGSALLDDGRVLVAGGLSGVPPEPSASAELYDPASNTWAVTGSLNEARSAFTLTARELPGQDALAAGGESGDAALSSTESYDAAVGTWSAGPALPAAYVGHAAVRLDDGSILVAGGSASQLAARLGASESVWSPAGVLLAAEPGNSLTSLSDGGVLLIGPNAPSVQLYTPATNGWAAIAESALGRSEHTATRLLDGKVLVVGGELAQGAVESGSGTRSVDLYDPSTQGFAPVGATSEPRARHTATLLSDGRVAVVGGLGVSGASGTEIYNPTWGTWTSGPGTGQGRAAHEAVLLSDGQLLVAGGISPEARVLANANELDASVLPTTITEYKLPARLDREITSATVTELWAAVARPATLVEGRRYPLVLFLHGNHGTCGSGTNPRSDFDCTYTSQGVCPDGFVVSPSHRGYDYVAAELAARGYIVVSVNANRGITCGGGEEGDFGFNLARGRLLLKHLQLLAEWNRGQSATPASIGASLEGKLDFTQLGMMGHSRGGEGVRAAYEQFRDPNSPWPGRIGESVVFRGMFEIGPVDGQTSRVLNADGTAWNVLLPMCDGDVSDLQGVKPFDRMLGLSSELRETTKSTFVAWGTNHNYFNTEWQQSDSPGCTDHRPLFSDGPGITGSAEQRQVGLRSMLTFFLANVGTGKNTVLNELFDPASPLESFTRFDRAFTPSLRPNRGITLEDFSGPTGQSARGLPSIQQNVVVTHRPIPEHDARLRGAEIVWESAAPDQLPAERFLQIQLSAASGGIDLSRYTHLELRVGRAEAENALVPAALGVQLVNGDGSLSELLDVAAYSVRLDGPVGGPFDTHLVLQSARIPLSDFRSATRGAVRGVRFTFPSPERSTLYLADIRASLGSASLSPIQAVSGRGGGAASPVGVSGEPAAPNRGATQIVPGARPAAVRQLTVAGNEVVALRAVENARVEIELATSQPFLAQDDHLVLEIGRVQSTQSRHPDGDLTRVVFTFDGTALQNLRTGDRMFVRYASNDARQWDFGRLDRSRLQP